MSQFDDIERAINERVRKINAAALVAVSDSIVRRSPVDTGMFKGSWFFAIGAPSNQSEGETGRDSLGAMKIEVDPMKIGQVGYFVSNLPYAVPLEFGSSDQAPSGVVRLSVANWQKFVSRAARVVK